MTDAQDPKLPEGPDVSEEAPMDKSALLLENRSVFWDERGKYELTLYILGVLFIAAVFAIVIWIFEVLPSGTSRTVEKTDVAKNFVCSPEIAPEQVIRVAIFHPKNKDISLADEILTCAISAKFVTEKIDVTPNQEFSTGITLKYFFQESESLAIDVAEVLGLNRKAIQTTFAAETSAEDPAYFEIWINTLD